MKKETPHQYLLRRLADLKGLHNQMAKASGVSQASVSRIFQGQAVPRMDTAQKLLNYIEAHDRKLASVKRARSARRVPDTNSVAVGHQ